MNHEEFWIFRRHDGHVTVSSREHPDEAGNDDYPDGKPDESTGEWLNVDTFGWLDNADRCMRGVCGHGKTTEETWQAAMARVLPMLESVKAQMIAVWDDVKPAVVALRDTLHTTRVKGAHAGLCADKRDGRCFCACRACTNSEGACACAHCDHEATS